MGSPTGTPGFDRGAFITRKQPGPKSVGAPVAGLLLLVVLIAVIAFGGYKFMESEGGVPDFALASPDPNPNPDLGQIANKLEEIEQRLERLEKRRLGSAKRSAATAKPSSTTPPKASSAPTRSQSSSASSSPARPIDSRRVAYLQRKYGSLEAGMAAERERWEATTDRLAGTVVEVGEQRGEIAGNREKLNHLAERFDREPISFELQKKSEKQRVGPVWLWLRSTNQKNHRYTLRVFADDKWIELKDRALLEPVELYLADVPVPYELVVTEIGDDVVAGILGVPRQRPPR